MRYSFLLLVIAASTAVPRPVAAQAEDTLPEHVVDRFLAAFMRHDVTAVIALWDTVSYFQDLAVPPTGVRRGTLEDRARAMLNSSAAPDPRGPGHRDVIRRMVVGRFVVSHIAVWWDPPYGDTHNFQKLEIYEVRNGKIVAEWDGQYTAAGRP